MNPTATSRRALRRTVPTLARRATAGIALAAVVLGVSACGSSSSSPTTTAANGQTDTTGGSGSTTATTSASATTQPSASLAEIESKLTAGQSASFVANYLVKSDLSGTNQSVNFTIAHSGTNALFSIVEAKGSFEEFDLAGKDTWCSKSAATWMCFTGSIGAEIGASLNSFVNDFGTSAALAQLKAAGGGSITNRTVSGQAVTCATFHAKTGTGVYTVCITSQGVLAEVVGQDAQGSWTLTLTKLVTSVPSNEFTPPATPSTIP